ncbi:DUF1669 domain-containing protein [bacterium]|nr:DUF1669 domain-containing protein [bacterium]
MLNSPIKSCGAQRSSIEKIQPRLTIPNYEPIENVEISVFPFDSLADNIMRTIDRVNQSGKSEKIFASTMSYGNSLAQAWNDFFRENRQHVFLALDAALSFSTFQSSLLARAYSEHPSIYIVPIIGGGLFESIYHWKFVVPETSNYASLSGMNLSLPSRAQYLDLIYHFSDAEVVQELRSYYEQMLEHNCQRRDDYQCLVDFMVPTVSDQVLLKKMFDRSCELFLTRQSSSSAVAKYFLQPQLHDISYLLKTKIRQAKQEIVVVMHKFSDSSLMDELHSAQQRGIRVVVITGTHPRVKSSSLVKGLVDYDSLGNSDRGFSPHMKIVIFDQTELFFGTGNLSRNALSDSAELYAITKNQRAIDSTLAQVKNLLYLAGDQRYKNIESTLPPEQWLLIQRHYSSDQAQAAARDLQRVAQFIAPGKFVHDRLRKINAGARQILANCGLDRLQIIHEKDLLRCQATADIQTLDLATH